MPERIFYGTFKQWAIFWFIIYACLGLYIAVDTFLVDHSLGLPVTDRVLAAGLSLATFLVMGLIAGGVFLFFHYLTRNSSEESMLIGPWASKTAKNVVLHFSVEEKRRYCRNGTVCGVIAGLFAAFIGISLIELVEHTSILAVTRAIICVCLYALFLFWFDRSQKRFLVSTDYAIQNDILTDQIKLFDWRRRQ